MTKFSIFDYLYRDASNYKSWGSLLLEGRATEVELEALRTGLNCGEFFIAEQVGIPPLYAELWQLSDGPTEDDHVWHTFHELRPANAEEITGAPWGKVTELIARFITVRSWDEQLSPNWDI
ncbi:MAG: hypothetical protein WBO95_07730 [Candidatus Dechloromonas phosphoritropha]|jgi:hypothetical protein